jgi:hypothetical protein
VPACAFTRPIHISDFLPEESAPPFHRAQTPDHAGDGFPVRLCAAAVRDLPSRLLAPEPRCVPRLVSPTRSPAAALTGRLTHRSGFRLRSHARYRSPAPSPSPLRLHSLRSLRGRLFYHHHWARGMRHGHCIEISGARLAVRRKKKLRLRAAMQPIGHDTHARAKKAGTDASGFPFYPLTFGNLTVSTNYVCFICQRVGGVPKLTTRHVQTSKGRQEF